MSFLDNTGLAYFYNKIKGIFIQSVNGVTGDTNGNVQINQVPLSENLTSPDAQASIDTFTYRTSGGSASLQSGEANLVFINGNMIVNGRVDEAVDFSSTTDINVAVTNMTNLRTATNNTTGTYALTYVYPSSLTATSNWDPGLGSWLYNNNTTSLTTWGLAADLSSPTLIVTLGTAGVQSATVVPTTFVEHSSINYTSGTYTFTYLDSGWSYDGNIITLSNYGIAITGTPEDYDSITITYNAGTPHFTLTVYFTAHVQGTLQVATPTSFEATGFNQFDKSTMYIADATISSNQIISNSGTYVCYCPAVGGTHGYIAESPGGHIVVAGGMGWCEDVPEIGSTVVTTSEDANDSVTTEAADFTYLEDGYIVVVTNSMDDLMMWCEWSGDVNGQTEYTAYSSPSSITIPTTGTIDGVSYYLPTYSYGMPRLGTVYDTINFESGTYIKRIEHLAYSAENLAIVQAMEPVPIYDYDATNIFYVLDSPISYSFTNTNGGVYIVDDHGTEKFIGTTVPVEAELLYGQNLRDKLRTDVLTISEQQPALTNTQRNQVSRNINQSLHLSTTLSSSSKTVTDSRILSTMRVINAELGSPANVTSDISWTTADGSVTFTYTLASGTTSTLDFDLIIFNT